MNEKETNRRIKKLTEYYKTVKHYTCKDVKQLK